MEWSVDLAILMLIVPLLPLGPLDLQEETWSVEDKDLEIIYTKNAPLLDGNIGRNEWKLDQTGWYFDAFDLRSYKEIYPEVGSDEEFTNITDLSVNVYALYDNEYIYFAANITDPDITIDSGSTFWRDDGFEVLIDGAGDRDENQRADDPWPGWEDGSTFLSVADGSTYHDYSTGTPYERSFGPDGDWFSVASVRGSYYIVETRIELDSVGSPGPNSTIGINFGVNDDDTGGDSKTALKMFGEEPGPGGFPPFKNETMWASARLVPYVTAVLPDTFETVEDQETIISGNLSFGNHPEFEKSSYLWKLYIFEEGDWTNITMTGIEFRYTFEDPGGPFFLLLKVTDPSGENDTAGTNFKVADVTPPEIYPEDDIALEDEPFTYILSAQDSSGIDRVNWTLEDSGTYYYELNGDLSFEHVFERPGPYLLLFEVFDKYNNSAEGTANITVIDNRPPVIKEQENMEATTGELFVLNATGTFDDGPSGPVTDLNVSWTLTGNFRTYLFQGMVVEASVDIPDTYVVNLTVMDGAGFSNHTLFDLEVIDNDPPDLWIAIPIEVPEGTSINLSAVGSTDNDPLFMYEANFTWLLELTDTSNPYYPWSSESYGVESMVFLPYPGNLSVELMVRGGGAQETFKFGSIQVIDNTPPEFDLGAIEGRVDEDKAVYIGVDSVRDFSGIVSIHFSIYDMGWERLFSTPFNGIRVRNSPPDSYRSLEDLLYTFDTPGRYELEVMLVDAVGLSSNRSRYINVRDVTEPIPYLNKTYVALYLDEMLSLSAGGSIDNGQGELEFEWFIDGVSTGDEAPIFFHLFETTGTYNVTVEVRDEANNSAIALCLVDVIERPDTQNRKDDELLSALWLFVISAILIGLTIMALMVVRKRNRYMTETEAIDEMKRQEERLASREE